MPSPEGRILRRAEVLWRSTLDGVLIRPPGADEVTKLAGTGGALWTALEEPSSFDDVCSALAQMHDAEVGTVAADLAPVIDDLVERGVVEQVG
ncbi:MAG: PqqD family protein [Acidimicrobiales bacterium]